MIKFSDFDTYNFNNAIRGARNPLNSWNKSDSQTIEDKYIIGKNDLALLKKLCQHGPDHRKFMRQIFVSVDITAPLYWWKEFDSYKVGTTTNSTSTMHKIHAYPFSMENFSIEKLDENSLQFMNNVVKYIEKQRQLFNKTQDKQYWWNIIQILPTSYNQMRTCTMTYENIYNIYHGRKNHKLDEWLLFCDWIKLLPYTKDLIYEL